MVWVFAYLGEKIAKWKIQIPHKHFSVKSASSQKLHTRCIFRLLRSNMNTYDLTFNTVKAQVNKNIGNWILFYVSMMINRHLLLLFCDINSRLK